MKHLPVNRKLAVGITALCICFFVLGASLVWATTPSTTFTISSGVYSGASSYTIYKVGSTYYSKDQNGALMDSDGDTNAATVFSNTISNLPYNGGTIEFGVGSFYFNSPITFDRTFIVRGQGSGLIWNGGYGIHATTWVWSGVSNNVPFITYLGDTNSGPEKDIAVVMEDIAIVQSSASTGTSAIYLDGTNSIPRHITFNRVNIIGFSKNGLEVAGTAFDIVGYNLGILNSTSHQISLTSGNPSLTLYNPLLFSNIAGTYAIYDSNAEGIHIFGGEIGNSQDGNGIYLGYATQGHVLSGVNLEGASKTISGTEGLTYVGNGLLISGGQIVGWEHAVVIGLGDANPSDKWEIDTRFYENEYDLSVTAGASRKGVLGYLSDQTITSIVNTRATSDGVYDILRLKASWQLPATNITVTGSPFSYTNLQNSLQDVIVSGGIVSEIEWRDVSSGTYYNLTVLGGKFPLSPGDTLRVTYSSTPTMVYINK